MKFVLEVINVRSGWVGRVPVFQPGGPGSITGGSGILISVLGLGGCVCVCVCVCPLSVFCPVLFPAEARHCADYTFRETRPCISVLYPGPRLFWL